MDPASLLQLLDYKKRRRSKAEEQQSTAAAVRYSTFKKWSFRGSLHAMGGKACRRGARV